MNKIIILLCAAFAVANADITTIQPEQPVDQLADHTNLAQQIKNPGFTAGPADEDVHPEAKFHDIDIEDRTDEYIKMNRLQLQSILQDYDTRIEYFKENYLGHINGINLNTDMVLASITQNEEALNPLEFLNGLNKKCIDNYRSSLITTSYAKEAITSCVTEANYQLNNILNDIVSTRNSLEEYLTSSFGKHIEICGNSHSHSLSDYTRCIINVAATSNKFAIENEKIFESQFDVALCIAKQSVKKALECSYTIKSRVISQLTEVGLLIDSCMKGETVCPPCDSCEQSDELTAEHPYLKNPFYGAEENKSCHLFKREPYVKAQ